VTLPLHPDLPARLNKMAGTARPEVFIMPQIAGARASGRRGLSETIKLITRDSGLDAGENLIRAALPSKKIPSLGLN
jgi:hypothetical protein